MAARTKAKAALVVAIATFACAVDDVERIVPQGERLRADDPVVKGREELFAPAFDAG